MRSPQTPLVTVLMPVYNAQSYLKEAIDSILNQSHTDFEFLIVDDGSTDESVNIINSYSDSRIRLIKQSNAGVSGALNTGLSLAKGKYIVRFDADDVSLANRIEVQLAFMEQHPDYVLVGCDVEYLTEFGEFIFQYQNTGHRDEEIRARLLKKNPFIHSAVIALKEVLLKCGGYDPLAHTFEDHLLWTKVIEYGKVCNLNAVLVRVRLNAQSVTSDERMRGARFLSLRQDILNRKGTVSETEGAALRAILLKQNATSEKAMGYHMLVAKKYLWNNYQPKKVRLHCRQMFQLNPWMPLSYLLFIVSFLPESWIKRMYRNLKAA